MGGDTAPKLRDLDEIDTAILLILQENPAAKQTEIAKRLKLSKQTICKRMGRTKLKNAVIDMTGSIEEILEQAKFMAARKIKRLIMSDSEKISLKACSEVLKANLTPSQESYHQPVRFVTVINEVGVLESSSSPIIIDADD